MAPKFNTPPNWPDTPEGWTPPPGWAPDPSWGEAPYGWHFWVDENSTSSGSAKKNRSWLLVGASAVTAGLLGLVVGVGMGSAATSSEDVVAQTDTRTTETSDSTTVENVETVEPDAEPDPDIVDQQSTTGEMVPGGWGMTMPSDDDIHRLNEAAENDGLVMTVRKFADTPTITINDSNYRSDSPHAQWRDVPPDKEGKFFVIETSIKNNTDVALDLTCGAPVDIRMLDTDGKSYGPIEDLYQIKGNPECNYQLEPGFDSKMTYAFAAPHGATADMLVFSPTSLDADDYGQPGTGITIDKSE